MLDRLLLALAGLTLLAMPAMAQGPDGMQLFADYCGACHMPDGSGQPGLAPPLVDPALWERLGGSAPNYVGGVILGGLTGTIEAAGQTYIGLAMPPHDFLADDEVIAIADYVLTGLNETGQSLEAETLTALRGDKPSHAALRDMRKGTP